jgi:hypothetical protein
MRIGTVILVGGLWGVSLFIPINALRALPKNEIRKTPFYAGFADIQATKTRFIIVGDTQRTSHWEFWRERNDRERRFIVDEITRREPAFVIHLGDLTTRGCSEKHWHEFDDMHEEFRKKKIPYFPILGNHEFYGSDKKALQNYFERFPHLHQRRWYTFTWKNVAMVMYDSNLVFFFFRRSTNGVPQSSVHTESVDVKHRLACGMDFSDESKTRIPEAVKYSMISCMGEVAEANKLTTNSGYIISQFVPLT